MFAARTNLTQWGVIRAIVVQDSLYLLRGLTRRDGGRRLDPLEPRAGGESSVILLHPPLPSVGVSTVMERGVSVKTTVSPIAARARRSAALPLVGVSIVVERGCQSKWLSRRRLLDESSVILLTTPLHHHWYTYQ